MTKKLSEILVEQKLTLELNPEFGTDKGGPKSYISGFYEENFLPYKDKEITLLEIGVRGGASLCLWKNYFSNKSKIYGVDNLDDKNKHEIPVNEEWISGDNVNYIIGDAYSKELCDQIDFKIDILIDDGPHTFQSHIKTLELYLPKINENGMIIIEDVSYNPNDLFDYVPDNLKESSFLYDFGGYDNRLIVIEVKN